MGRRRRWVLLSALLLIVSGCDPAQPARPSDWTPPSVTWTWPPSRPDLSSYLPTDAALADNGLVREGLPVPNPRIELLRACDFTQPWDGLVKQGLEVTWRDYGTGQDVRQYITRYDHVAGKEVLNAIDLAASSCGRFPLDGKTFHSVGGRVGFATAHAADARLLFCGETEPPGLTRCLLLLASADRLTEIVSPGGDFYRSQIDFLVSVAGEFADAIAQ